MPRYDITCLAHWNIEAKNEDDAYIIAVSKHPDDMWDFEIEHEQRFILKMVCPHCKSFNVKSIGMGELLLNSGKHNVVKYKCNNCNTEFDDTESKNIFVAEE